MSRSGHRRRHGLTRPRENRDTLIPDPRWRERLLIAPTAWNSERAWMHPELLGFDPAPLPWTVDPQRLLAHDRSISDSGRGDVTVRMTEHGLAWTDRRVGVHCLLTPDEQQGTWHARLWLVGAARTDSSHWLIPSLRAWHRMEDVADRDVQDLAIACLDLDRPDGTAILHPAPGWDALDNNDHNPLASLEDDWFTFPHVCGVKARLRTAIRYLRARATAAEVMHSAPPALALTYADPSSDALPTTYRTPLLTGTWHGYPWALRHSVHSLSIAPPGHDPLACPWWTTEVDIDDPVFTAVVAKDRRYPWLVDAEMPEHVISLIRASRPAPYLYWFPETFRGGRCQYGQGTGPTGLLADGTWVWPGSGASVEEAHHAATASAFVWSRAGRGAWYAAAAATTPGNPARTRRRNRGRLARRKDRITVAVEPVAHDPRDFTSWPPPSTLA